MNLNFFVQRTNELNGLHPGEIEARQHGWTYGDGYQRGSNEARRGTSFYGSAFPDGSQAMQGYIDGYRDHKKGKR